MREQVDLAALLQRTARRWRAGDPDRHWKVECPRSACGPTRPAWRSAVDSAVENVVGTPRKDGPSCSAAWLAGDEVVVEVADDGTG